MKWETTEAMHQGGRDEQQDSVLVLSSRDGTRCLLVVGDGMGGHQGGALASKTLTDTARRLWDSGAEEIDDPKGFLEQVLQQAHEAINAVGEEHSVAPRSTAAVLYTDPDRAVWATIGDSRIYRFEDGDFVERSRDHSVVQMLVDIGKITEAEMGTHPDQNRLTQSLGGDGDPEPAFGDAPIEKDTAFLLCSDGLWEMVAPEEMAEALASPALARAAEALVETAFERAGDGSDNVSVALARPAAGGAGIGIRPLWLGVIAVLTAIFVAAMVLIFAVGTDVDPDGRAGQMPGQESVPGGDTALEGEGESEEESPVARERGSDEPDGAIDQRSAGDEETGSIERDATDDQDPAIGDEDQRNDSALPNGERESGLPRPDDGMSGDRSFELRRSQDGAAGGGSRPEGDGNAPGNRLQRSD